MGRAVKQVLIATILSGSLAGLTGCMSMPPKVEPTATATKHRPKVVRMTTAPKIGKQKKIIVKKVVTSAEEPIVPPPVVPAMGGGGTGGGSSGGGWGG